MKKLFPLYLCAALLGFYVVVFGGALVVERIQRSDPNFFTPYLALLDVVALLVQWVALVFALWLLIREPRYRSAINIFLTIAGVAPTVFFAVMVMIQGEGRFHM